MSDMRFDGKVAIVTGAGGRHNLGRSFARHLAAHGAKVVVNDIDVEGAERVAREIADEGGAALGDGHDIGQEDNAQAVVQRALDAYGRLDILVNNAGAMVFKEIDQMSPREIDSMVDSHLKGSIWLSRAAWPHFRTQQYGRIVMILSTAGGRERWLYYTAKAGLRGLNYALAQAGAGYGIKVNGVVPLAGTDATVKHTQQGPVRDFLMGMSPDLVAPIVGVLAHEQCPTSGEEFLAINGSVRRYRYEHPREGRAPEFPQGDLGGFNSPSLTMADVRDHWAEIIGDDYRPLDFSEAG